MNIREKVARAFCQASCDIKNCPCHYADGDQELKEATAAIKAFLEAIAEQGWRMVPEEATEEMRIMGMEAAPLNYYEDTASSRRRISMDTDEVGPVYRAMLAAAPKFELGE